MLIKKINTKVILSILTIVFSLCSFTSQAQELGESKVWILKKMNTGRTNVETSGDAMAWQEHIVLHYDKTFFKHIDKDGESLEAEGNYEFEDLPDGKYLKLTYTEKNDLIANCTSDLIELIKVNSEKEIQGTAVACDKSLLTYELAE